MDRRAFTLMEILVSVMIFSVISIAMVGILSTATSLFRGGESARAANDEAIAVMSLIDADLRRMVPEADGGFVYTKVLGVDASGEPITDPDKSGGNMVLAFKIKNPDTSAIKEDGIGANLIVIYWVDVKGILNRCTETAADSDGDNTTISEYKVAKSIFGKTGHAIARGCLYFGVDISLDTPTRTDLSWTSALPISTGALNNLVFTTEKVGSLSKDPFPGALRLTLAITGGNRNAGVGSFISQDTSGMRISGIRQVPIASGSMARIGDINKNLVTWVEYDNFKGGVLSYKGGVPPARRRTTDQVHTRSDNVYFCPTYTLVRTFPR